MSEGDLSARIVDIEGLFRAASFRPAAVQRDYQWGQEQCAALFSDVERAWRQVTLSRVADEGPADRVQALEARDRGDLQDGAASFVPSYNAIADAQSQVYFLGSFVVGVAEDKSGLEVFDGLQRLTTLTILLAVLRDLAESDNAGLSDRLAGLVHAEDETPRLRLAGGDQTLANLVQRRSEAIRSRRNLSGNSLRTRLLTAAGLFSARLRDFSDDDRASFAAFILSSVKAAVVHVGDERLARQIFITTNNRGIPLNEADVLKSQINSISYRDDVAKHVLSAWTVVSDQFEDDADYMDFLYAVDFLTRRAGPAPEGLTELGTYLANRLDDASVIKWTEDYQGYAQAWAWLRAAAAGPAKPKSVQADIQRLYVFHSNEWKPLALVFASAFLAAQAERDKRRLKVVEKRFDALHKTCAALILAGAGRVERADLFARALGDVARGRNPFSNALALTEGLNQRVASALDGPVHDAAMSEQVLKWLTLGESKDAPADLAPFTAHPILPPQSDAAASWLSDDAHGVDLWRLSHLWGNWVLAPADAELGRSSDFRAWKKAVAKLGRHTRLTSYVLKDRQWGAAQIEGRTQTIALKIRDNLKIS